MKKLSIIIPTYKRHLFLLRLLKYYNDYDIPINLIILDSTPDKLQDIELLDELQKKNIIWKTYDENIFIVDKIADGFSYVETEFSVLCADDDFMIPSSLVKCVDFLTANPDYTSCQGMYYLHTNATHAIKNGFTLTNLYSKACSLEGETGKERFSKQYIEGGSTGAIIFYAVHKTSVHSLIWNEAKLYSEGLGYAELFPCAMSEIYGKSKVLPIFYSSREPNNITIGYIADKDIYREMHSQDKTEKLLMGLSKHLSNVDGISLAEAEKFINQIDPRPECLRPGYVEELAEKPIKNYLTHASCIIPKISSIIRKQKHLMSLLRKIKRSIKTRKGCPRELYPYYYKDFIDVKNAVVSAGLTYEQLNISRTVPPKNVSESITKE